MSHIEIAWTHSRDGFYIEPGIADLLGWTAEEIMAMPSPFDFLMPSREQFGYGCPGITARTTSEALLCKDGSIVPCRVTVISRHDEDGEVVETFGSIRQFSQQYLVNALITWWEGAHPDARRVLAEAIALCPSS